MNRKNLKQQHLVELAATLLILVFANILSGYVFTRIDLTAEKRFSLSTSTRELASGLKDEVFFKIYLAGDLPPGFRRLQNSTREILDEFRVYAGDNIQYEFINPSDQSNDAERAALYKQLAGKGLTPTNLEERDNESTSQKIIFPGAIVSTGSKEVALQLLKSRMGSSPDEMLNNSIENLEYEICSAIQRLTTPVARTVAFLQGHDELNTRQISDAARSLSTFYKVDTVSILGRLNALKDYDALIIAKPRSPFDEKDKFIIDQYIMKGGKVFWLIDKMQIEMDSLKASGTTLAIPFDLNLDDQLFHYGVRINDDLVMDMQAAPIPVVTGYVGNQPKQELFPWYYFPLFNPDSPNPIVHNLNAIKGEFVSSLDTIEAPGIRKTILLTSSRYSRLQSTPARVSLNMLRDNPDPREFSKSRIPVAVLLEGKFSSNFSHRLPASILESPEIHFSDTGVTNKMIVVSDGDIIASDVSSRGTIYPLGFDRFTRQTYGNKSFVLNCMDYLCGDRNILELRGKIFKLRMLDPGKARESGFNSWTAAILPVLIIVLYGMIRALIRRRKYAH